MMNSIRHLSPKKISIFFAAAFFFSSCSSEKEKQNYAAKVDDSLLISEDILKLSKFERNKYLVEGELTRKWIDSEVIKKEAEDTGIFETKEFIDLIEEQKIKFAESILIQNYINENYEAPANFVLENFYESNKDNFVLQDEGFVINIISFSDEVAAIDFRNILIDFDWERALKKNKNSEKVKAALEKRFYFQNKFYNSELLKLINQMEDGETSIIVNSEPNDFKIVQVIKKLDKFSIPEFNYITEIVEQTYKAKRMQELHNEYLNKLYDKYNVELKTEQ